MLPDELSVMQRVCNRGYGWYVAAKIGKAIGALPVFLLGSVLVALIALWLAVYRALESLVYEFLAEVPAMVSGYWKGRWFSGFSRKHWASLYRKPKPTRITAHLSENSRG